MATYTVNLTGSMNSSYGYATINGTKITTTGTNTYTSKPTIAVYVSSSRSSLRSSCKVTLNGTTVKSGYGSYTADIGDADIVNIQFNAVKSGSYTYYTCDVTTETSTPPDPMAPHDGHNTNIGQVARQIEGGTVRLGGVGREIGSGLTLVNGVSREIEISGATATLKITGNYSATFGKISINGFNDSELQPEATVEVPVGTIVYCYVKPMYWYTPATVTVNGETKLSNDDDSNFATYEYEATKNATISFNQMHIAITEE